MAGGRKDTGTVSPWLEQLQNLDGTGRSGIEGHFGPRERVGSGVMIKLMVGNQRGGVGKTTTAVTLARCFADRGLKTLLVDADPQGSVGQVLKLRPEHFLNDFIFGQLHLRDCVVRVHENLDVLCGGRSTTEAEQRAVGHFGRERLFEDTFSNYDSVYDAVIVDVSPSITLMQACAMVYTGHIVVPVSMDTLSVSGAHSTLVTAQTLAKSTRAQIKPLALLPTIVNKRFGITEVVMGLINQVAENYDIPVLEPIRTDQAVTKAMRKKAFLHDEDPQSKALADYQVATDRILELFGHVPAVSTSEPQSIGDQTHAAS